MTKDSPYSFFLMLTEQLPYSLSSSRKIVYYYCDTRDEADSVRFSKHRRLIGAAAFAARRRFVRFADINISDEQKKFTAPWIERNDETWQLGDDFFSRYRISDDKIGPMLIGFPNSGTILDNGKVWRPALALLLDWNMGKIEMFRKIYRFCRFIGTNEAYHLIDELDQRPSFVEYSIAPSKKHFAAAKRETDGTENQIYSSEVITNDETNTASGSAATDDDIRFSVSDDSIDSSLINQETSARVINDKFPRRKSDMPTSADFTFDDDTKVLLDDVRQRIDKLKKITNLGFETLIDIIASEVKLSDIVVDNAGRIKLIQYNTELNLSPMPRAVYLLFLKHRHGIRFKELPDYCEELENIYAHVKQSSLSTAEKQKIELITTPTNNSINVQCSRIKNAVLYQFDERIAKHYYIDGSRAMPKSIDAATQINITLPDWLND